MDSTSVLVLTTPDDGGCVPGGSKEDKFTEERLKRGSSWKLQ